MQINMCIFRSLRRLFLHFSGIYIFIDVFLEICQWRRDVSQSQKEAFLLPASFIRLLRVPMLDSRLFGPPSASLFTPSPPPFLVYFVQFGRK